MRDHREYVRRCPVSYTHVADDVLEALGITQTPPNTAGEYFQKRKDWLQLQLATTLDPVEREAFANRIYPIVNNSIFPTRLGLKANWDFDLTGPTVTVEKVSQLGGTVDTKTPWHARFWMGGFDGDLMCGYLRGTLAIAFTPFGK